MLGGLPIWPSPEGGKDSVTFNLHMITARMHKPSQHVSGAVIPRAKVMNILHSQPWEVQFVTFVPATTEEGPQRTLRGRIKLAPQNAIAVYMSNRGYHRVADLLIEPPLLVLGADRGPGEQQFDEVKTKRASASAVTKQTPEMAQTV